MKEPPLPIPPPVQKQSIWAGLCPNSPGDLGCGVGLRLLPSVIVELK